MIFLVKKILLSFFLFLIFCHFGNDVQAEEETTLREEIEKLKTEVLKLQEKVKRHEQLLVGKTEVPDLSHLTCEHVNDDSHECKKMCQNIYEYGGKIDVENCEKLPIKQIEGLARFYNNLKYSAFFLFFSDFAYFEVYLDISIASFKSLVDHYHPYQASGVLVWIIANPGVTEELLRYEDDEFSILDGLLKRSTEEFNTGTEIHKPFIIGRGDRKNNKKIMEIAINGQNDKAVRWLYEYIVKKDEACSIDVSSIDCFTVFCKIGKNMDKGFREDWLYFDDFEEYIDVIILNETNGADSPGSHQWNTNNINYVGDVTDFYEELCGNLATADK